MNLKRSLRDSIFLRAFLRRKHSVAGIKEGYPRPIPSIVKQEIVLQQALASRSKVLVETGTFLGEMVFAQLPFFDRIYSIELSKDLYQRGLRRFRSYPNVTLLQGDSSTRLGEITAILDEPAVFWLDGHYSGGITARGEKICPIYAELQHVFESDYEHTILIDDARLFDGTDDYPRLEDLEEFIRTNSDYRMREENDMFVLKQEKGRANGS